MTFRSYNPNLRYKERAAHRMAGALGIMALMIICLLLGFWLGRQRMGQQLIMAEQKIKSMETERDQNQEKITELSAAAQTAIKRYEQLQNDVNAVIPKGPMQDLVSLIKAQIEKGMKPDRLEYLIKSGRPPTGCVDPQSKRFVVKTPTYEGSDSKIDIEDGLISVTALGVSANNKSGQPEAWFDATKSVSVSFMFDGKVEQKKGVLPIQHSLVAGNREYRFTVEEGAQSFARVTFDSCDYP